jgi:hypothetical protein
MGVALAALLLLQLVSGVWGDDLTPILFTVGVIAVAAGIRLSHWLLVPRRVSRMFRPRPSLVSPTRFVWNDHCLEAASDAGVSVLRWPELYHWFEGTHGFVFLLSDYMLLILPARALSALQADDLRSTLLAQAPEAAKSRG